MLVDRARQARRVGDDGVMREVIATGPAVSFSFSRKITELLTISGEDNYHGGLRRVRKKEGKVGAILLFDFCICA